MEKVKKLSMCRICLVENVRMYVVTNKRIQEVYEKLTDIPFVTEDSRPMLACSFCCTKLKHCCQLRRKCLEAEALLAQMLSEDYEQKPLINQEHLELAGGFIISPIENINIVEECQTECNAITQELAVVCEQRCGAELKVEHPSEELDPIHVDISVPDVEDTPALHSTSESEDNELLMVIKIEPENERECSEQERRLSKTEKIKLENPDESYEAVEDISGYHSVTVTKDVPFVEIKIEPEDFLQMSKDTSRAGEAKSADITKTQKLNSRKRKVEEISQGEQTMIELSNSTVTRTTKTRMSESVAKFKKTITTTSQSSLVRPSHSKQHDQIHTGEKPFKCEVCQRSFSHKSTLARHFMKHSSEKSYKCEICQRSFGNSYVLKRHIRIHSGEKQYKCEICQRSFSQFSNLKTHSLVHTGEKPYKCEICQHSFRYNLNLKIHFRKHTGEYLFKCDICERGFNDKRNLRNHIRGHSGEKPYKCEVCQRSYSYSYHLKRHSRVHTKFYKCEICQRSFGSNSKLEVHFRIHTGEKPYTCEICQRSFIRLNDLTRHNNITHTEKPVKCAPTVYCPTAQ